MRKNTITINGAVFEVLKSEVNVCDYFVSGADYNAIYKAYDRPSFRKVSIWTEWCKWCFDNIHNGIPCTISICSHSCTQFSISGKVQYGDHVYGLRITKAHNMAFLIA